MDAEAVLARTPLFAFVLNERQRAQLAARSRFTQFPKDAVLMSEGDFGASMYVLVDGRVDVEVNEPYGTRHVATLGPDDIVGEMSLLTGARRTATVTAHDPVVVLEITKVALEPMLAASPELFDLFCETLDKRKRELEQIHADARAWHILGMTPDEIVGAMKRFFGR